MEGISLTAVQAGCFNTGPGRSPSAIRAVHPHAHVGHTDRHISPHIGIRGDAGRTCPAPHHLTLLFSINQVRKTGHDVRFTYAPWHFLYFFPLPQGQGSLRPVFCPVTTGVAPPDPSPPTNCNCSISRSFLRWMLRVKSSIVDLAASRCCSLGSGRGGASTSPASSSSSSGNGSTGPAFVLTCRKYR